VIVLEDVDLVAEDRSYGPGSSPVLFDLLDAMDGADADADLLFLLTTNRADLLEPALAARPGRVDVAVEVALPDTQARRQLLVLYSTGVPVQWSDDDIDDVLERTAGVTASFLKELVRRAVLESLHDASPLTAVTGDQLRRAVGDLLDTSQQVTRNLLGVGGDPNGEPVGRDATAGFGGAQPSVAGPAAHARGWVAYAPMRGRLGRSWTPG
jgi:ATP-dependent 26S proteasome regulatory subunit